MTYFYENRATFRNGNQIWSKYFRLFTYWLSFAALVGLYVPVHARSRVVSRKSDGDEFSNPSMTSKRRGDCTQFQARCIKDLDQSCRFCKCNRDNETYRFDLKTCVSSEHLDNYTGCAYKGLKDPQKGLMDDKLATLDLSEKHSKDINAPLHMSSAFRITCDIDSNSGFLNKRGQWTALTNLSDSLKVDVRRDPSASFRRYLNLNWEGVNKEYFGLLIKLQINCNSMTGADLETNCFLFKTKGEHRDFEQENGPTVIPTSKISIRKSNQTSKPNVFEAFITLPTKKGSTTKENVADNYTYTVPLSVLIGVAAGVACGVLAIIILAVYCVRCRTRNSQETKAVVTNEAPKVHFTAQTRFSLITESSPARQIEMGTDDYACLQDNRGSFNPYCSLREDDADFNIINQVLKEAASMESMEPSSEPRYSCRLSGDQTVIKTVAPRSSKTDIIPVYHVLEGPGEANEPDYEEVGSSDEEDVTAVENLLKTKPPLPGREHHVLEQPTTAVYSEC